MLRRSQTLINAFQDIYPTTRGLVDSTAAARVNGYLGGHGDCSRLKDEISELGLSEDARRYLVRSVCRGS
jgi:peptide-methionine (S)-S-oxide reductase